MESLYKGRSAITTQSLQDIGVRVVREGLVVVLDMSDPMKQVDEEFLRDEIFMKERDLFEGVEQGRSVGNGGVEQVDPMYRQKQRIN